MTVVGLFDQSDLIQPHLHSPIKKEILTVQETFKLLKKKKKHYLPNFDWFISHENVMVS